MKYKHKLERLKMKQNWWDKLPERYKASTKRPGSIKSK